MSKNGTKSTLKTEKSLQLLDGSKKQVSFIVHPTKSSAATIKDLSTIEKLVSKSTTQ